MSKTISMDELPNRSTAMLRDLRAGATYILTDDGQPVADIVPRKENQWVPATAVDAVLRELGADEDWGAEIAHDRQRLMMADPWDPVA